MILISTLSWLKLCDAKLAKAAFALLHCTIVVCLWIWYFRILLNLCDFTRYEICNIGIHFVDGLPAFQQTVCEYYDPVECSKDPSHCNSTKLCEQQDSGKRSHCYAFLKNLSGTVTLSKKGCWLDARECYNKTRCVARDDNNGAGNFFCCCEGDMCNENITLSTFRPRPTSMSNRGQHLFFYFYSTVK